MTDDVVRLGAWCDWVPEDEARASPGSLCFAVEEFADLADGRRVTLHSGERGFGISGPRLADLTVDDVEQGVLTTMLPGEDEPAEDHPYDWLRDLLRQQGVETSVEHLRRVPYAVVLSDRLQGLLVR